MNLAIGLGALIIFIVAAFFANHDSNPKYSKVEQAVEEVAEEVAEDELRLPQRSLHYLEERGGSDKPAQPVSQPKS